MTSSVECNRRKTIRWLAVAVIPFVSQGEASRLMTQSEATSSLKIEPQIDQLKAMVADQQSKLGALQQELSGILSEVTAGKQAFQQQQARTNGGGPGATVEIEFPAPPPPQGAPGSAPNQQGASASGEPAGILQGMQPPEMLPIPVMVVKPDSVADVEEAMTQVMEEQAAVTGSANAKTNEPPEMLIKSPEEQLEEAISRIDKLEAEKTHYKYDMHAVQSSFSQ